MTVRRSHRSNLEAKAAKEEWKGPGQGNWNLGGAVCDRAAMEAAFGGPNSPLARRKR